MEALPVNDTVELMYRRNNGLEVFLNWHREANILTIVMDDSSTGFNAEFVVPNDRAMMAFEHPYVYAPREAA